jgi:glutamyl-tRNA synthetase
MIDSNKQLSKLEKSDIASYLQAAKTALNALDDFSAEAIQQALNQLLETTGQKPGILFSLIRLAVSWAPFSPALNDTLAVLGKDTVSKRLDAALNTLDR